MSENNKSQVRCPVCENDFDLDPTGLSVGDIVECPICGATLEIVSLEPLMVQPVTKEK